MSCRSGRVPPALGLQRLSLTTRYALVSLGVVLALGAGVVAVVDDLVQREAVTAGSRSGVMAAGFVRHILPADAYQRQLSEEEEHHLDELVATTPALRALRVWALEGQVLHDSEGRLSGRRLEPGALLRDAYAGRIAAQVERDRDEQDRAVNGGGALLEVYVPCAGSRVVPWSGWSRSSCRTTHP